MKSRTHHHHHHRGNGNGCYSSDSMAASKALRVDDNTADTERQRLEGVGTDVRNTRRWQRRTKAAFNSSSSGGSSWRRSCASSSCSRGSSSHLALDGEPPREDDSNTLTSKRRRYRNVNARLRCCLPGLGTSPALTVALVIALQLVVLQPTVLHCAKTFYMHWNTTNSIFRIDNTDHIIDVNKGNSQFEYDQVHIICPVYEPGTFDNETEKYIIYNVSKVEYETCRITNHDPRIIAICDKPNKLMFFTITFRPFTPQPGGLEFLPGNDYYFISTSSKDDLHRRIGGRCTTDNMKVVFKVCCADDQQQQHHGHLPSNGTVIGGGGHSSHDGGTGSGVSINSNGNNTISIDAFDPNSRLLPPAINTSQGNIVQNTVNWPVWNDGQQHQQPPHLPPHVRPPPATPAIGVNGRHNHHYTASPPRTSINSGTGVGGSTVYGNINNHNYNLNNNNNNPPSNVHPGQSKPTKKTKEYDKHPNEVVKNEELTYNNGGVGVPSTSRSTAVALVLVVVALVFGTADGWPCSSWRTFS
uniref:Ephrin RBD domain-containing protein n=1 Tax=Anopheles dirus TaxID=7168 RepID=A0A182NEL9_9DIPT